jgi:WD40 repeat protein
METVLDGSLVQTRVFLSHTGADTDAARAFAEILRRNGIDVWFDKDNLKPGDRWMESLETAIAASSAMVVYVGRLGVQHWVDREVRYGLELNTREGDRFKLIPVLDDRAEFSGLPPFLSQQQGIRASDPDAIRKLLDVLHGDGTRAVPTAYWATHSPFRSLQSFEPDDAWLFFGRDRDTGDLLDRLQTAHVLMVIGNSGSGKSSLLRAGLVPALRRGRLSINGQVAEQWRIAIFRPGADPFGELVDHLPAQLASDLPPAHRDELITRWRQTFPAGGDAIRNGLAAVASGGDRTLLVVDQFEELFTLAPERVRHSYIDGLLNAAESDRVWVVLGLRADFYAHCLAHPRLKPFLEQNFSVLLMKPEQLREAIESRLALAGVRAEDGLTDTLLADVATEPGNLALLEYALAQLWDREPGRYNSRPLTNKRYEEIGRLKGAIGRQATAAYAALPSGQQQLTRRIFVELVHLGEGAQDTSRRVTKETLLSMGNADDVTQLLDVLASKRLIATSAGEKRGQPAFVEVSHEALIREWAELRQWVDEDREEIRFARRLESDAEDWQRTKEPSALLRGARLLKAEDWLKMHAEASEPKRAFVTASRADEEDAQARKLGEERQLRDAAEAREHAERIAESRQLAAQAEQLRAVDQPSALKLALSAFSLEKSPEARLAIARCFSSAPTTLQGHTHSVQSAAFSPDGMRIVTASWDRTARVWDARTGQVVATLAHRALITSAMFSPDGKRIVTASADQTARVWDARTGQVVARLGHTDSVSSAAFSPDGMRIVTASDDQTARVWSAGTAQVLATLRGHTGVITSAAFSPDRMRIVTASADRTARVWDAGTGQVLATLQEHTGAVLSAAFSPDGMRIVTASVDHTARVWDARTGQVLATLQGHTGAVLNAAFSPDGTRIVTASDDHTARVWDAGTGQVLATLQGHTGVVQNAAFSPDQMRLVTASADHTARVWDARTGQVLATLQEHTGAVLSAAFSPDGMRLVTASADHTARVWDAGTGQVLATLQGHTGAVLSAAVSPDGTRIVTASADHTARVWDADTGQGLATLQGHTGAVLSAAFSPDGTRIVTASADQTARVWDAGTRQVLARLGHTDAVSSAAFSPDGMRIVTASADHTARVWDAGTGQVLATLLGHTGVVQNAAFSPDEMRIVTASDDHTARVWDARTGQGLATLQGHTGNVWSAAFSPDGTRIVTASWDRTARVWDARTGQVLDTLQGHTDRIISAAFSPDGARIVTASWDRTARVWDARTGQVLATLQGHPNPVNSAAFAPDGTRIVTAGETARVFRILSFDDVAAILTK